MDPQIYLGSIAAHAAPAASIGPPDWDVGAHHGAGRRCSVLFADASARSVPLDDIRAHDMTLSNFTWFAAQ